MIGRGLGQSKGIRNGRSRQCGDTCCFRQSWCEQPSVNGVIEWMVNETAEWYAELMKAQAWIELLDDDADFCWRLMNR